MLKAPFILLFYIAQFTPAYQKSIAFMGAHSCPHFDNYFNRVVMFQYKGDTMTIGVLLDSERALTSYNPYRIYSRYKSNIKEIEIIIYLSKNVTEHYAYVYQKKEMRVKCARQIIPLVDAQIPPEQWHGINETHSPVHDMMVVRLSREVDLLSEVPQKFQWNDGKFHEIGPLKAEIAGPDDEISGHVKIGATGINYLVWQYWNICSVEYDTDDLILDCDDWIPRNWGHFICLDNRDDWVAMASGAILVSNDKVFGIGSFVITKGTHSILAFTDVRPYQELINNTCTVEDQTV